MEKVANVYAYNYSKLLNCITALHYILQVTYFFSEKIVHANPKSNNE